MTEDYGCDPIGNGQWKLVPSGQVVDKIEFNHWKANRPRKQVVNDCLGLSWMEIETKQGGKLRLTIAKKTKKAQASQA